MILQFVPTLLALALSPLLLGIINRTKAKYGGRVGPPLIQPYYDLAKLLRKGAVYSQSTTWVFRAGPMVSLAVVLMCLLLVPLGTSPAPLAFEGDIILLAYLLGVARFFMVAAALDTGSAFEGMGASREVFFSALAEPALLLGLAAVEREVSQTSGIRGSMLSLSAIHDEMGAAVWVHGGLVLALVAVTLTVVLLAENSRIPVDDPNTHLELTMIHEVIVLDHGGPDLAFILYAKALKLWVLGALLVGIVVPARSKGLLPDLPSTAAAFLDTVVAVAGMFGMAILVGVVESGMARLRLPRIPQLLVGATALAALALVLEYGLTVQ